MVSFSYQSEWLGDSRTSSTSEPPPTTEPASSTWPSQTLANSETRPQKTAKEHFCFVAVLIEDRTEHRGLSFVQSNSDNFGFSQKKTVVADDSFSWPSFAYFSIVIWLLLILGRVGRGLGANRFCVIRTPIL